MLKVFSFERGTALKADVNFKIREFYETTLV